MNENLKRTNASNAFFKNKKAKYQKKESSMEMIISDIVGQKEFGSLNKKTSEAVTHAIFKRVVNILNNTGTVTIPDIGKLKIIQCKPRNYAHPISKDIIHVKEKNKIKFLPTKKLKSQVNK